MAGSGLRSGGQNRRTYRKLDRQVNYVRRLETVERFNAMLHEREDDIAYLHRKLSQPKVHEKIAHWVMDNFQDRLILHPKT